jgi:hypothetical protein
MASEHSGRPGSLMARWSRLSRGRGGGSACSMRVSKPPSAIGEAEGIDKGYVSLVLRLALLATNVVEAILEGRTEQADA